MRDVADLQLFFGSDDVGVYQLIKEILGNKNYAEIQKYINFRPHYVARMAPGFSQNVSTPIDNCMSRGQYCAYPRYDLAVTDGRQILHENIRQKCVYNFAYGKGANQTMYWAYMINFYEKCIKRLDFHDACSFKMIEEVGIGRVTIENCVQNSYITDASNDHPFQNNNTYLEEDYKVKKQFGIKILPTLIINNKTLQGAANTNNVLEAICAGLETKPQLCYENGYFVYLVRESPWSALEIVSIVILIILLNLVLLFVCKRYVIKNIHQRVTDTDINRRIDNVVSNYLALRDQN